MSPLIEKKQVHSFYFFAYILLAIMIVNASYLSYKYINFYYGGDLLASLDCSDDCDSVMMSEYSMVFGIPVPVYGLSYFIALALFFFLLTNYKSEAETQWKRLSQAILGADKYELQQKVFDLFLILGCIFAIGFLYILYFKLEMICKFCLLSHSALFLFAITYFFLLKRFKFGFEN